MNRFLAVMTVGLTASLLAFGGDDPFLGLKKKPQKPAAKQEAKKNGEKIDKGKEKKNELPDFKKKQEASPKPEDLIASIRKNMEAAQNRLKKKDPNKETQDIQKKILDDLDKLINQDQKNNQKNAQQNPKSGMKKQQKGANQKSKAKPGGQAKVNPGQRKSVKKADQGKQVGKPGKKPAQAALGGNAKKQKETKRLIDEYPDFWGHLPLRKRMELDAYSRERFMPGYEDVLIEYYRSISQLGK